MYVKKINNPSPYYVQVVLPSFWFMKPMPLIVLFDRICTSYAALPLSPTSTYTEDNRQQSRSTLWGKSVDQLMALGWADTSR